MRKQRVSNKDNYFKKLGTVLIVVGIIIALFPVLTNLYSYYYQRTLKEESVTIEVPENEFEKAPVEFKTALLEIPSLDVSVMVVRGTSEKSLRIGPGWYEQSSLPGEGNTAIAGHRTPYGGYFRNLDRLVEGDTIMLSFRETTYVYSVDSVFIVEPTDWSVIASTEQPALTLTTCHPLQGTEERLIVRAYLSEERSRWDQIPDAEMEE